MLDDSVLISGEFASTLEAIQRQEFRLVCFDFGGTLHDFVPLHVRGFTSALGIERGSEAAQKVERAVREALVRGVDSFEMLRLIATALSLPQDTDLKAVVVTKRSLVEVYLREAELSRDVCTFLTQVMSLCSIAVISLGLVTSMETVLMRSLGDLSRKIAVYGRRSLTERVNKLQLLRQAIQDIGAPRSSVVYVGDAEVDECIGNDLGVAVIRLRPFRSSISS